MTIEISGGRPSLDSGYAIWTPTGDLYTLFPQTTRGMKEAQELVDRLNEDFKGLTALEKYTWGIL